MSVGGGGGGSTRMQNEMKLTIMYIPFRQIITHHRCDVRRLHIRLRIIIIIIDIGLFVIQEPYVNMFFQ